jgi:hypothetical protein
MHQERRGVYPKQNFDGAYPAVLPHANHVGKSPRTGLHSGSRAVAPIRPHAVSLRARSDWQSGCSAPSRDDVCWSGSLHVDADEMLSPRLQDEIRDLLKSGPPADGYLIRRLDQLFWEMNHPGARLNFQLKLFDKHRGRMNDMAVHSDPEVDGKVEKLKNVFYHFSEVDIHTKVEKINAYSTGIVADKLAKGQQPSPWKLVYYPPLVFLQQFFLQRDFLSGWAGFIGSVVGSVYAFLRYAKLSEHYRFEEPWSSRLPDGAPLVRDARDEAGRIVKPVEPGVRQLVA